MIKKLSIVLVVVLTSLFFLLPDEENIVLGVSPTGSNLTSGFTDDVTETDTASISPTANNLILLSVTARNGLGTEPATPTITGNGLTWELVDSAYWDTTSSSRRKLFVFRAMGSSPSTGVINIDFGETTTILWSVNQFSDVDTSGTNGSGAIVQSVDIVDEGTTTSLTATLAAFSSTDNATYGAFAKADGTNGFTEGSGFSELSDVGATFGTRHAAEWKSTNDTSVDMSYSSQAQAGAVAIEIKAYVAPAGGAVTQDIIWFNED